jgi:hypothetical protein
MMKSNYPFVLTLAAVASLAASTSLHATESNDHAGTTNATPVMVAEKPAYDRGLTNNLVEYYQANELSLDGFGTLSLGSYTIENPSSRRVRNNSHGGVGAGVNYFITRYVGVGGEMYSENTSGTFIDNASANLILRLPLGDSGFAPYILGGGGHQFDGAKLWFGQAGGGMEYRFCHNIGIFVDGRMVWPNETKYYGVCRAGLRFAF